MTKKLLRDPRAREFFFYLVPALVIGLLLRGVLVAHLPHGIFHDDTPDFLSTPDQLFATGKLGFHEKKTFLYPLFLTVHCLLPVPVLVTVPLTQHLLGLVMIVMAGLLCRLWFKSWRCLIVPVTMLVAVDPHILWYEHTLMAEALYAFCTLLLACAGTIFALRRTRPAFWFLCGALLLEAGARPEGKMLFGFGLLLVALAHWGDWRVLRTRFGLMCALAIFAHFITRTQQGGLLLYTTVARMTPDEPKCAPGFGKYIAKVREELRERWEEQHRFPGANYRREITAAVKLYLSETRRKDIGCEKLCQKLAIETCRRNLPALPGLILAKLQHTAAESPSGRLDELWLWQKQKEAFLSDFPRAQRMAPSLLGRKLASEQEIAAFIETHYRRENWFEDFFDGWNRAANFFRLPDQEFKGARGVQRTPNVPLYFVLGAAGLAAAAFRRGRLQAFHFAWGLALAGLFLLIFLTANVKPRFRYVFEPFWFLYLGWLFEWLWLGAAALRGPGSAPTVSCVDQSDLPAAR